VIVLRIEWLHGRFDVSSIEGRVRASKGEDGTIHLGRGPHSGFLWWSGAPDRKQNCEDRENQEPVHALYGVK
jgi:hypothetical protein